MDNSKVLVVLSGGQDSTTCLAWAKRYFPEVHAVTFDYNQRHEREIQAACDVATIFGVHSHEVVEIGPILKGASPLTDPTKNLELYEDHDSMAEIIGDRVELTFVPMRNALFLTLAANRAAVLGIDHMVTGVCQADNANYPDCRASFIAAQQHTIQEALAKAADFTIHTPLMDLSKDASVQLMRQLGGYAALAWTHTSYDGQYPPLGKDHATILRAYGFEKAGLPDPLVVRAAMTGLMPLPLTANYQDPLQVQELWQEIQGVAQISKVAL
jgi:7-cyano-7-deazaguanine synthase